MTRLEELMVNLQNKKDEMVKFQKEGKREEAYALVKEVEDIKKDIEMAKLADEEEVEEIKNIKIENKGEDKMDKLKRFVNYVQGKATAEERAALKIEVTNAMSEGSVADGGALVPFDEDCTIIKLREAGDALQNLITVKPVATLSGKKTVRLRKAGGTNFAKVGEKQTIGRKGTPQFKEINYSCEKYGAIYDITNELIDDSVENVMAEMNDWIGNDSRELRNSLIVAELSKKEPVAIASTDDIKKVFNVTLNTENAKYASILTNQDGFHYLDTLKDANGNYLLQPTVADKTKYTFDGRNVHVLDNSILATVGGKAPIFIGDLEMAIVMFDRQQVAIKVTGDGAGAFENDETLLRAIEREDVQTLDAEAFVHGQITITATRSK